MPKRTCEEIIFFFCDTLPLKMQLRNIRDIKSWERLFLLKLKFSRCFASTGELGLKLQSVARPELGQQSADVSSRTHCNKVSFQCHTLNKFNIFIFIVGTGWSQFWSARICWTNVEEPCVNKVSFSSSLIFQISLRWLPAFRQTPLMNWEWCAPILS